jgi:hypothetical protein
MHIAVIAPSDFHKSVFMAKRRYHMALAHAVLADKTYARFMYSARELGSYVIMDNSLMENGHKSFTLAQILEAEEIIQPHEVILPDVFRDGPATCNAALVALNAVRWRCNKAAVVQGSTPQDLIECYRFLSLLAPIDVIHLPKVMEETWSYGGRAGFLTAMMHEGLLSAKPHHMLGIWYNPLEVAMLRRFEVARSLDTALPIQAGIQGVRLNTMCGLTTAKPKRVPNYFGIKQYNLGEERLALAWDNVEVLDQLARER